MCRICRTLPYHRIRAQDRPDLVQTLLQLYTITLNEGSAKLVSLLHGSSSARHPTGYEKRIEERRPGDGVQEHAMLWPPEEAPVHIQYPQWVGQPAAVDVVSRSNQFQNHMMGGNIQVLEPSKDL